MRVFTASLTEIEVVSSTASPSETPPEIHSQPVKPYSRLTQPLLCLAAGAIAAFSITFFRCDHRETNTYVHAEPGAVVHMVNGEPIHIDAKPGAVVDVVNGEPAAGKGR